MFNYRNYRGLIFSSLIAFACAFFASRSVAGPGAIDTTFNVIANNSVYCTLVQPNGKILVGGAFGAINGVSRSGFARLNPDGSLDTTITNTLFGGGTVYCMLVQPDGKFVLGGNFSAYNQYYHYNVIRLNPDGSIDGTFTNSSPNNAVYALAMQTDGKILIGGQFSELGSSNRMYIARLNTDGTMDNSFNAGSIGGTAVFAIAVQSDGNILVGGQFNSFSTYGVTRNYIARLTTNGTPDISYTASASSTVYAVYLEPSGKSVWAGAFVQMNNASRHGVARLNTDGSLDSGYPASSLLSGTLYATTEDTNDEVYAAGQFEFYAGVIDTYHEGIVRTFSDSTIDTNFNTTTNFNVPLVRCVALQPDGRVIVGGQFTTWGTYGRTNLVRLYGNDYPAEIITQPHGTNIAVGGTATFSVDVDNPTPVDYQWYYNGTAIPGATDNEYSVFNAQIEDVGTYNVYVGSGLGGTTSSNAVLQVGVPISITQAPTNMAVVAGNNVTNAVAASGTSPSYYWTFGSTLLSTNTTLVLTNVEPPQDGAYRLVVSNFLGGVTNTVTLTALEPVNITYGPGLTIVTVGMPVTLLVGATGNPVNYQWFQNGNPIPGANLASYYIQSAALTNAGLYSVTVSNQLNSMTSQTGLLQVGIPPQNLQMSFMKGGTAVIQMPGTPGFPYTLQVATNLNPPVTWQTLFTYPAQSNGVCTFIDTNATTSQRYYQVTAP